MVHPMSRIPIPRLPVPAFDLSHLDATSLANIDDRIVTAARDAAYVTIGFGVLAFQQAQVRRREIEKVVGGLVRTVTGQAK